MIKFFMVLYTGLLSAFFRSEHAFVTMVLLVLFTAITVM
jgi:hypothetical protein